MTIKENYLGIFVFLVVSPTLLLLVPSIASYLFVGFLASTYLGFRFAKPRRRCLPCGEIVSLTPLTYAKVLAEKLACPRCGTVIKNKHRV